LVNRYLFVERPVSKVELAEGLEVSRRNPQYVAGALHQEVDVAKGVYAGLLGTKKRYVVVNCFGSWAFAQTDKTKQVPGPGILHL
jgi:hypothetical protein